MATIGQQLLTPETGWRRYDQTNLNTSIINGVYTESVQANRFNSSFSYINSLTSSNFVEIQFKFWGSKFRLISDMQSDNYIYDVYIDGILVDSFSQKAPSTNLIQGLTYEKTSLSFGSHTVKIKSQLNKAWFYLDAIDIDSTGYLVHPILNEVHDINNVKNIGDCIPCRYTALTSGQVGFFSEFGVTVAPLIPIVSSDTPNGSFYWVYVGKDYLGRKKFIADRNIQHSISWDTLNTKGIINETILATVEGKVIYHYQFSDDWKAINVFDNNSSTSWSNYNAPSPTIGYIGYDFGYKTSVSKYSICGDTISRLPKNWTFEGSNDGTNWVILDTKTNVTNWVSSVKMEFTLGSSFNYNMFRVNFTSLNGDMGECNISELNFYVSKVVNYSIRLLTGGTSATDTDNEWDKIIANSTLGGTIIAGDNNVWNWSGSYSWTSTSLASVARVHRGSTVVNSFGSVATTTINTSNSFRPVLLVESLNIDRFLIKKDGNYYTLKDTNYYDSVNHVFMPLTLSGGSSPNESDIDNFGFDSLALIINTMTKGSDSFIPAIKLQNFDIEYFAKN